MAAVGLEPRDEDRTDHERGHARRTRRPMRLLFAAALIGGCLPLPSAWSGDGDVHVVVFGDSLTFQAERGIDHGWAEQTEWMITDGLVSLGHSASLSAMIGAVTEDLDDVAHRVPEPGANVLVIALGTNDMRVIDGEPVSTVEDALANIDEAIEAVAPACTVLVGIADTDTWSLSAAAGIYNDELRSRADVFVDWAQAVAGNPHYLKSGNVHHTAEGSAAYRQLILDAADACADQVVFAGEE